MTGQQSPVSPLAEVHFNPIDSGYQSPLASPLSETKPHLVASSPIPADQISLQGQLSDDLQPDPPAGTIKGCLHNVTQPCQSCELAAIAPSQQHDVILDTSVPHSSTLIPVCDSVLRPDGQHLEPGTTKEDMNPDTFTDDADVLLSK